jgi:hypothetical protein
MTLRIVQWGTGNVGQHSLRAIIARSNLELVGVRVYDDSKVGLDAGVLCGADTTGVVATTDVDSLIALGADCVVFNGLGTTLGDLTAPLDEVTRVLASGTNVVSTAFDALLWPPNCDPDVLARVEHSCTVGRTSFFQTGLSPGFATTWWPLVHLRASQHVEHVAVTECIGMAHYTGASAMQFMGFGLDPSAPSTLDAYHDRGISSLLASPLRELASALGVELDEVTYSREAVVTDADVRIELGLIPRGTVAAQRMIFGGLVGGREVIRNSYVWRVSDEVALDWPLGDRWLLEVRGEPSMKAEIEVGTLRHAGPDVLIASAAAVNAIPAVCSARVGVLTALDVPIAFPMLGTDER